jgi:hypothetical protein
MQSVPPGVGVFLRQHGPHAVAKQNGRSIVFLSHPVLQESEIRESFLPTMTAHITGLN